MKDEFKAWMKKEKRRRVKETTAVQYANAIDHISEHYYQQANVRIYLYNEPDINLVNRLVTDYGVGGRYENFGENGNGRGHGTVRAAIKAYAEFLEYRNAGNGNHNEDDEEKLKHPMDAKLEKIFPGYRVFRKEKADLFVLENENNNELLIVELKPGNAGSNSLPPILEYCGLIYEKYPSKTINGKIIAGEIDESLKKACSSPVIDIGVMKYQLNIGLGEIV
jgi:hypothetical protein